MIKYLSTIIFAGIINIAFGQTEKLTHKTVSNNFQKYYNIENFDSIFSSFSKEMQEALPIGKTRNFLTELKSQSGKIIQKRFVKYENSYASYKTTFEKGLFIINVSVDNNNKINGFFIKPFREIGMLQSDKNKTKIILPVKGRWTVVWGGDTKELNYHIENPAQKNAFDIIVTNNEGKSYENDGKVNENYYAFGKEVIAPCDGEIVLVVDGVKDNMPGILNPLFMSGNTVILKTLYDEYLCFAHFKQNSITVKQGQKVKQKQLIGLCGNSGNSSEPHLHFHMQNKEDMNSATGIKCYFDSLKVNKELKTTYSPIQKDNIQHD